MPEPSPPPQATRSQAATLLLLGFVTLFLELVLIRYLAGNIWNLGYFPNLVLMGVFVGMGLGFVFHQLVSEDLSRRLFEASTALLLVLVVFVQLVHPAVPGFRPGVGLVGGEVFYTGIGWRRLGNSLWMFLLWFLLIVAVFVLVSQRTAKLFRAFSPLTAYTLDIAGSCCGILSFMAASWLELPAFSWFLILAIPFVLAYETGSWRARARVAVPLAAVAAIAWYQDTRLLANPDFAGELTVRWSPYQKVEYAKPSGQPAYLFVNGVSHQVILDDSLLSQSFYQAPYASLAARGLPPNHSVLVIGAGSGNDVAVALMNGVAQIDAVEIDPVIVAFGRERHPARPYDDPRVRVTVGDARAFANLIFSISFRGQQVAEHLFGWNLLGATLGGVLEYTSMALGYNALAVVVAACYTLVFLFFLLARRLRRRDAAPAPVA